MNGRENMHTKRLKVGQVELEIQDNEHTGPAIVFLHFSGANLIMWSPALPYFQDRFRLVLIDLRGHGRSEKPASGYHMDDMAGDVAGLMQALVIDRFAVVGSSLGAEVGLSLAANYPQSVSALVCDGALSNEYGPYGTWEGTLEDFKAHVARQLQKMEAAPERVYPSVEALLEFNRASLAEIGWWNEHVEAMERYGAYQLSDGSYTRAFMKPARIEYMRNYFHYRLEDYYPRLQCPLLMLPGEDVFENPAEKAAMQGLKQLAPRSQIADVPGWQHPYAWMLNPQPACQAILEFLAENS
jgi:pimeloyl-ACP methyl ester carboxylesterase